MTHARTLAAVLAWSFFITRLVLINGKWTGIYGWRSIDGHENSELTTLRSSAAAIASNDPRRGSAGNTDVPRTPNGY